MPKRRRLLTPMKKKTHNFKQIYNDRAYKEVSTPRGRLKGALQDALDPVGEDSDSSIDQSPLKRQSQDSKCSTRGTSEDEAKPRRSRLPSPQRQSYVLKLFDRSVDLSQFEEDSPLYPICRAWMINQPKANYKRMGRRKYNEPLPTDESVELPGPEGPHVSRIPELLPEQQQRNKDNINLNYRESPPPSRECLLSNHLCRWGSIKRQWAQQGARVEARYKATHQLLSRINVNSY